MWVAPPLASLQSTLANPQKPIGMRMRATYFLRQAYDNYTKNLEHGTATTTDEKKISVNDEDNDISLAVVNSLSKSLDDNRHGALLRHEFAYVLGQLRDDRAIQALEHTLLDDADDIMVRHECAEALGAISSSQSIPALEKCANNDSSIEVGETCRLALDFIQWKLKGGVEGEDTPIACACMLNPYSSVDPAPPHPKHEALSSAEIGEILTDESAPMFERYRAMFSLRNRGGIESVKELGNVLVSDKSSALLRHEVAYILGQMQHPDAVEYLEISLKRQNEHRMVRHESAEALGAIEERWGECEAILGQFLDDADDVVRESCMVALDAADYWGYSDESAVEQQEDDESKNVERTNFSIHKAETNGKAVQLGVLHNHFNVA
mmetsp:Transcript_20649/g.43096  ORF Transcript_20649/g.43096 Transcript_20649/m.43096 type:complete len:380 (+) Transcript_20649:162-1301(+)|eukprot:CAMPEP_0196136292 /NCGR_PEP_ID=MMETSP0910-20130528/4645_1 /TAXON_ID=49265 /ORGANISM="Thalassiosira rotula, Strain GSO102" /LENGTH=379 /DNA_ID=CAMNT_0041396555 /DNA_START=80 /DNA_END=1219 /DNA_ORIENTATION=+